VTKTKGASSLPWGHGFGSRGSPVIGNLASTAPRRNLREERAKPVAGAGGAPPVSAKHAAHWHTLHKATSETPDLSNDAAELVGLMQEKQEFLAERGVDPRHYSRYEPKF
jgi:hypothetical protein